MTNRPSLRTMRKRALNWTPGEHLQSLAEWSDNHTVGEVLAAQGIDHGAACHLDRRGSVTSTHTVERDLRKRPSAQRFPVVC